MKKTFSTHWLSSTQKRKQRKYRFNAPLHIRHSFLNAPLSKELKKKYGKRSFPVKKGDEVLIMRGAFKKKKAKVASVNHKRSRVALENIQRAKKDGTKVNVYFNPSKIQIITLNVEDKKRLDALNKKLNNKDKIIKTEEKKKPEKKNASN